jgi:hypothetical protein
MVLAGRISRRAVRIAAVVVAGLVVALLGLGCASSTPARQEFVELRTRSFHLTSSLSEEETREFARRLEFFHAGVLLLLGLDEEATPGVPTPVLLFDDRSFGRPFALNNDAAYLLDAVDAPVLVFRSARDFTARATPDLRHRYAHRVLRDHSREERPLWYEEGVAQLARTLEEVGDGVRIGRVDGELTRLVLDWRREDLLSVLQRTDLSGATRLQRELFDAQVWSIAHTLEFSGRAGSASDSLLDRYREALDSKDAAVREEAFDAIGLSPAALVARIYRHLEARQSRVRVIEPRGYDPRRVTLAPISRAESRTRLGELALSIDRPELAARHFELALEDEPDHLRARIGHVEATARQGTLGSVEEMFEILALAPDAPGALQVAAGDAARAIARASVDPAVRSRARDLARERYAAVLAGAEPSARAQLGMALSYLEIEGEDAAASLEWIEAARRIRAGSLRLELALAEAEARTGAVRSAQIRARNVVSRTHDVYLERSARDLLDRIGGGSGDGS